MHLTDLYSLRRTLRRSTPLVSMLGATSMLLAACGGHGDQHIGGGDVIVPPPPPSVRGTLLGSASVVPVSIGGGNTVQTLDPNTLGQLLDAAQSHTTDITGTPTCAVTTYTVKYHTVGSAGEATDASTAIMVPSGSNAACQGGRPVLLYAHGTSVLKSYDMTDLTATEPRLIAAMFASQGYIVVAPNYAGYAGSSLPYASYLDAAQESNDMIDALRAARLSFAGIGIGASSRLMVAGYSQGGNVALATQRAMQLNYASEFNVTAAAPMSGPYAMLQFGDTIFSGAPSQGSSGFLPLVINAAQRASSDIYTSTSDVYEDKYATGIDTLLPGTLGLGDLVAAGKLPNDVMFAQDSLPQTAGYASFFGADHLIKTSYRDTYLADQQAHPCNVSASSPLDCAPAQPLRKWLLKNDLRTYVPTVPVLLCGGNQDPVVPFNNTDVTEAYFKSQGMAPAALSVLDLDDSSILGPNRTIRTEFQALKQALRLSQGTQAVTDSYHAGLVAPFCLRAARDFLNTSPNR